MVDPDQRTEGASPSHVHVGPEHGRKGVNWLAWLALLAGLLALIFLLSRCGHDQTNTTTTAATTTTTASGNQSAVVAETPGAPASTVLAGTSAVGGYLAGTEPTPRTFQFDKLNFDTAKSEIRSADVAEVNDLAATLNKYPNAKIRIAGYADSRGSDPANMALGKARADAIKSALVAKGVNANRIATGSGGEHDPVATNATASGRFENRRTELVVTSR